MSNSVNKHYMPYWLFYTENGELIDIDDDQLPEFISPPANPDHKLFNREDPWEEFLLTVVGSLCSHFSTNTKASVSWSVIDRYGMLWWRRVRQPQLQKEWRSFLKWKLLGWLLPIEPVKLSIPLRLHVTGAFLGRSPWTRLGVVMQRLIDRGDVEIIRISDYADYGEYHHIDDAFYRLSDRVQMEHQKRVLDLITE